MPYLSYSVIAQTRDTILYYTVKIQIKGYLKGPEEQLKKLERFQILPIPLYSFGLRRRES